MAKTDDFIDFSDPPESCRKNGLFRPIIDSDRHKTYEDVNRSNIILAEMYRFLLDKRFCDVTLRVENVTFYCHRLVLAASSLYFERMFCNGMCEANAKEITLNDVSAIAIRHIINFAYTCTLEVSRETVLEIFEAADMLEFMTVRGFCEDFLLDEVVKNNCLLFMMYSHAFSCKPLYEKAKLCAATNFEQLSMTSEFFKLPFNHLLLLLQDDNLEMPYEEGVYEALCRWMQYNPDQQSACFAQALNCIRLNYISRWYLIEIISKDKMILNDKQAQQIINEAKDKLLAQGHTYEIPWQVPPSRKCTGLTEKIVYINTYDPCPSVSEVFLFDVINKSWSCTGKSCPLASEVSTCERVGDAVLIIGGWQTEGKSMNRKGPVNIIHEFRVMRIFPTLWYVGAYPMGIARYLHSTVVLNGKLYLFGGYDETHSLQATAFVTDIENGYRFDSCAHMIYPVCRPAVCGFNDKIFLFGGYSYGGVPQQFVQCYDPAKNLWTEIKSGLETNQSCQYVININGLFYLLCGYISYPARCTNKSFEHNSIQKCIDSIIVYNPVSHTWQKVFEFAQKRTGSFCVTCLTNKIYITGGNILNQNLYNFVDCYTPSSNIIDTVGNIRDGPGILSLCTTITVMHQNFGL